MKMNLVKISKFLSLVLRHEPKKIGISLDDEGWTDVDALIEGCCANGLVLTRDQLDTVVHDNKKQRFAFSEDRKRIRASQGHSVKVDLGLEPVQPPDQLYHGTVEDFLPAILKQGLLKRQRHHVHLSVDKETATRVGFRRGKPEILTVRAKAMWMDGYKFFLSANGVWLTEEVPPKYLIKENS